MFKSKKFTTGDLKCKIIIIFKIILANLIIASEFHSFQSKASLDLNICKMKNMNIVGAGLHRIGVFLKFKGWRCISVVEMKPLVLNFCKVLSV